MEPSLFMRSYIVVTVSLLLSLQCLCTNEQNDCVVIVVLPHDSGEAVSTLERHMEILPGAEKAIESINNDTTVLADTKLAIVTANGGLIISSNDEPFSGNMLEIMANLTLKNRCILGIAGLFHPSTLLILQTFQVPIVSLVQFGKIPNLPSVLHVTASSSVLVQSLSAFVAVINQTRIGVISESDHLYYSHISNVLIAKANVSLFIDVSPSHGKSLSGIGDRIEKSNVHVIFLSARPSIASSVLLQACQDGLQWPHYAWILHGHYLEDLLQFEHSNNTECSESDIFKGIILLQLTRKPPNFDLNVSNELRPANPFSFVLHDAIWTLALLADNRSSSPGPIMYGAPQMQHDFFEHSIAHSDVYIYQVFNLTASIVGVYSGSSNELSNVNIGTFIKYGLITIPNSPSPFVMALPALTFITNTLLLVLYICFRKHPDIKSTNVTLSLLIFIGCYLLISHSVVLFVHVSAIVEVCMLLQWLSSSSFPFSLVLATVLLKMLQVYHIFTLRSRLRQTLYTKYLASLA